MRQDLSIVTSPSVSSQSTSEGSYTFGRVLDVILDDSHPEYENKGGAASIYGVFYSTVDGEASGEDSRDRDDFAYIGMTTIKKIPTIGEIVKIESTPKPQQTKFGTTQRQVYIDIVNMWNHPNSNTYLDVFSNPDLDITSRGAFVPTDKVNPLNVNIGDTIIQGRQAQSIRFTGAKGSANENIDDTNVGDPMIIVSNGQKEAETGFESITEDVNEDSSSIYIVSNHVINLTQANEKRDSYDEPPTLANQYKGNQLISTSGRIYLNAKEESILLSGKESIGLNARTVNIDSDDYMCLDSKRIYLGKKVRTSPESNKEPVLLGNQTERLLSTLLNALEGLSDQLMGARTIRGHSIPNLNVYGAQLKATISGLKRQVNPGGKSPIKSKKVFTE